MKKFGLFLVLVLLLTSCRKEGKLDELDRTIEDSEKYEGIFRARTDSLVRQLSLAGTDSLRFRAAWELSEQYKVYNIDTCLIYAHIMLENARSPKDSIIARSALVYPLASVGREEEALAVYESIPKEFPYDDDMRIYYEGAHHLFLNWPDSHPEDRKQCQEIRQSIREDLFLHDTTSYFARTYMIHTRRYLGQIEEAAAVASSILEMENLPVRYRAINEYNLGSILRRLDREDEAIDHFINAAILDLSTATKEYNSLHNLAKRLYERGDSERACRYMLRTMNDAIFCNYKSHYKRSSAAAMLIHQAFLQETASKKRNLTGLLITLSLLLAVTILLFVSWQVYSRKERKSNERIRVANIRLKDDNLIRDLFLSRYMEKSAYYIQKIDEMKSHMRRTYKEDGLDSLLKILRGPAYADKEFKNYFHEFDTSIVRLFPTFVEDVNSLMGESHQFTVEKDGPFNTELRILALIRLGITDSSQIAKALNTSISTVYSYRYRLRRDAICPADDFEKRIREIGLD